MAAKQVAADQVAADVQREIEQVKKDLAESNRQRKADDALMRDRIDDALALYSLQQNICGNLDTARTCGTRICFSRLR